MQEVHDQSSPPSFQQISYNNQTEINYLNDIGAMGPDYVVFLQSLNFNQTVENAQRSSYFDNVADDLFKKIVKQGYIERPSKVIRKNKKGDSDINYYNSSDNFIDDLECCIEKKDKFSTFEDYSSVAVQSIEELYASTAYTKKLQDLVVEVGKRKAVEQFSLSEDHQIEKFDEIKKNIRNSILNRNREAGEHLSQPMREVIEIQEDNEQEPQEVQGEEKSQEPNIVVLSPPQQDKE